MSSSSFARRGATTALTVLAAAVLFLVGFAPGSASAAKVKGSVAITIPSLKAGKLKAIAPAKAKRAGRKGAKVTAPVKNLSVGGPARVAVRGGLKLRHGKRQVKIRALKLTVRKRQTVVRGKLGKKNLVIFKARGKAKIDRAAKHIRLNRGKLSIPRGTAVKLKRRLKLRKAPTGKIGSLFVNAKKATKTNPDVDPCVADPNGPGCPIVDPYLTECGVEADTKIAGTITPAGPLPEFANQAGATGPASLDWGFKNSYRNYVTSIAGGSIHVLDGATTTGAAPAYSGFKFPSEGFRYTDNGTPTDLTDDKAVLEGTGTALFCGTKHGFRVALSNPALVIDGANSRIDADVDANLSGTWITTQRVTVAKLDPSKVSRLNEGSGSVQSWENVPATLTAEGSQAVCGVGELDKCSSFYPVGTELDPISLSVSFDSPVVATDQFNTECGVPVAGIIENSWPDATPLPTLADPIAATSPGGVQWGFLASFRGYVYGTMAGSMPPPDLGDKALQALDGASRFPTTPPGSFDPTRGFAFPVDDAGYAENDPADTADDQAIVNGTGTSLFCNSKHGFWVSISNPTVVIDGASSRIVADVSQNTYGPEGTDPWQTTQRIDLADLDLSGITPTYGSGTVTWDAVPVTLSEATGSIAGSYEAGKELDPITVSLETE